MNPNKTNLSIFYSLKGNHKLSKVKGRIAKLYSMSDTLDMTSNNNKSKTTPALIAPAHEYVSRISSTTFNGRENKETDEERDPQE